MTEPTLPHFLVINRYDDEDADYPRYCAGYPCELSYVTRADGAAALPSDTDPGRVRSVADLEFATVLPEAWLLAERYGAFDGVVGMSEYDVLTAAQVRDALGAPGPNADLVRGFRDKVLMKQRVAAAGLAVPRFLEVDAASSAEAVVAAVGLPLVLKPRARAASAGVLILEDPAQLAEALREAEPGEFECEEFISTEIYHVDGVLSAGKPHFLSVSGYLNTPLDFVGGKPLGSVILDPGAVRTRLEEFAVDCVLALGLETGCFHLEVIRRPEGEPVFLEVGMRPGGAEVPALHREVYGIDLMTESFRTVLGLPLLSEGALFEPAAAGWIVFPEPAVRPSRVLRSNSVLGKVPHVYAEARPEPGEVYDGSGGYWRVPGRFRLAGPDENAVRASALRVLAEYEVEFELDPA